MAKVAQFDPEEIYQPAISTPRNEVAVQPATSMLLV
jgi:hypothetical protein